MDTRTAFPRRSRAAIPPGARTTLCRHCATLIRFWPELNVWRHVVLAQGRDHAPEPMPEGEARAMWGDR